MNENAFSILTKHKFSTLLFSVNEQKSVLKMQRPQKNTISIFIRRCDTRCTFYDRIVDKIIFMVIVHHTFNKSSTRYGKNAFIMHETKEKCVQKYRKNKSFSKNHKKYTDDK